ncbi:hypothetical protein ABID25_006622 [Mesorhizobium abyssinicae]
MHLPDALPFVETPEYKIDRLADPQIWVFLDPVPARVDVTDRHRQEKFARRAFSFRASIERARRTESSSSLIVPFMPSSSLSLG